MMSLGRDTFIALSAIGWSDHRMTRDEADAICVAARQCGIAGAALDEIVRATRERTSLFAIDVAGLTDRERMFVYAMAAWVARADGHVVTEETSLLAALADVLELRQPERALAIEAVEAIACLASRHQPARFEVLELARLLDGYLEIEV